LSAYMIIEVQVLDPDAYAEYVARVPATVERYGGRYHVRGGRVTPIAGDWTPERVIIVEFPSLDHIRRWLESPEYAELAPIRERATRGRAIAVEGIASEAGQ